MKTEGLTQRWHVISLKASDPVAYLLVKEISKNGGLSTKGNIKECPQWSMN